MDDNWILEFWKNKKKVKKAISSNKAKNKEENLNEETAVRVRHFSNTKEFLSRIKSVGGLISYVGIPANSERENLEARKQFIEKKASKSTSPRKSRTKKKQMLQKAAANVNLSNAYLLHIFSKGSPLKNQPPRPVLEAALKDPENRAKIAPLVAKAIAEEAAGRHYKARQFIKQAGTVAAKCCRDWFHNPRNEWAPNSQSTIKLKGKDEPGIFTDSMRNAITHVEKEDPAGNYRRIT